MEKLIVRAAIAAVFVLSLPALSATYNACASGGNCNSYNTNPGSSSNLGAFQPGGIPRGGLGGMSAEAMVQKRCSDEKGRIESENARRLRIAADDNLREIGRCQSESNTGWSGSVSGGHKVLFGGGTYTVENPSYDKCVDRVGALYSSAQANAFEIYTRDKNTARSANNAECAGFYN